MVTCVLSELCRRTLTAARLDALPAALRRRPELQALRYAVALAAGDKAAPGRQQYLGAMTSNLVRLERFEAFLAAGHAAGLKLMPIKGALLTERGYGDPGARPMADLDVVCAPAELARAVEIGRALGLALVEPESFRRARDATHDVKLTGGGVIIELHHQLWHELRIARDVAPLLARARPVPFGPTTAWAPDDADHLYVVCVHAATHGFTGNALWLSDAALIVAGAAGPLWPRVQALAGAARGRVALAAARDQLRLAMPWLAVDGAGAIEPAPLRRAIVRQMTPWLHRGELALGTWPSRVVRPLLFDRRRDLGSWALEKLAMWRAQR